MGLIEAAAWGFAGGLVAALVGISVHITDSGYRWPRHVREHGLLPLAFVVITGLAVSTIVAAAAHAQMTGAWPALIMGVCAPSVVRGFLARVQVTESTPSDDLQPAGSLDG